MSRAGEPDSEHWWTRRGPSVGVLTLVLFLIAGVAVVLGMQVAAMLPQVGKDKAGEDPWAVPVGIESIRGFEVVHVPDCAVGAITRISLWDAHSKPFWSVTGPASPLKTFSVGATPPRFTVVTPFHAPPKGTTLWLVVIRRGRSAAGIRYKASDLVENRVVSGKPLRRYTDSGYQTADVCGTDTSGTLIGATTQPGG